MAAHAIRNLYQPSAICHYFEDIRRSEKLDAIRRRITKRTKEMGRNQNRDVMRLTIERPSSLLNRQACRQATKQ
jgi:hypothetical protein